MNKNAILINDNGLEYIQFPNINQYRNIVTHCFTTRRGGVSKGECSSLNMGLNRNDLKENVIENFKRVADSVGINYENIVFSNQVHDNKIKSVSYEDRGKGILKTSDIIGYDGLITDKKGVALVTFYADCIPIYFFDPEKCVIAISHSGWRGTVKRIAKETVNKMNIEFGCENKNIEIAIGPSIGKCCFEVGNEVYSEFVTNFDWYQDYCVNTSKNKWHIDLQGIIKRTLIDCGINDKNIFMADICTKCNSDLFFSYRADGGKTGSMVGIMQLL